MATFFSTGATASSPSSQNNKQDGSTASQRETYQQEAFDPTSRMEQQLKHLPDLRIPDSPNKLTSPLDENLASCFRHWLDSKEPQVVQTLIQAYAAVLIAREKRYAHIHENLCNLWGKKVNADTFLKVVQEKCRSTFFQVKLKERFSTQRESLKYITQIFDREKTHKEKMSELTPFNFTNKTFVMFALGVSYLFGMPKRRVFFLFLLWVLARQGKFLQSFLENPMKALKSACKSVAREALLEEGEDGG